MKNKVVKKLMMIVMAATMLSGFSFATVYANADPPAEETTTEVVAETSSEATTEENTEDTGRVIAESDSSAFSTPGNAQLVDDKENDDTLRKAGTVYKHCKFLLAGTFYGIWSSALGGDRANEYEVKKSSE